MVPMTRARHARNIRLGLLCAVLALALLYGLNRFASARSLQLLGTIVDRVETDARVVALTFDDGPRRDVVQALLPLLAAHHAQATFFVEGQVLERDLELGREIIAAGHELGNHSYSHKRMLLKSQEFIAQEIERTDAAIRAAGQGGAIWFRPPFGKKLFGLPRYLAQHQRPTIMWNVEPTSESSATQIATQIASDTQPGSIILLHVMYPSRKTSLAAVPAILEQLSDQGYRIVRISDLLGLQPITRWGAHVEVATIKAHPKLAGQSRVGKSIADFGSTPLDW